MLTGALSTVSASKLSQRTLKTSRLYGRTQCNSTFVQQPNTRSQHFFCWFLDTFYPWLNSIRGRCCVGVQKSHSALKTFAASTKLAALVWASHRIPRTTEHGTRTHASPPPSTLTLRRPHPPVAVEDARCKTHHHSARRRIESATGFCNTS